MSNQSLDEILNQVWDLGWQAHKSSHVKGNRIDPIELRSKATSQAKELLAARIPKPKEIDGQPDAWDDIRGEYHTQESIQKQFYWTGYNACVKEMQEAIEQPNDYPGCTCPLPLPPPKKNYSQHYSDCPVFKESYGGGFR